MRVAAETAAQLTLANGRTLAPAEKQMMSLAKSHSQVLEEQADERVETKR